MKLLFRQLLKNKAHTLINVLGLSMGVTCALVLYLMVQQATNYDRHHSRGDDVYRVVTESLRNGREDYTTGVPVPFISAFETEFPEVLVSPVQYNVGGRVGVVRDGQVQEFFEEDQGIVFLRPAFFQLLDRQWLIGTPEDALAQPSQVAVSERIARKYFNRIDVVGESIEVEGVGLLEIQGVLEDFNKWNTDFPFDIIISYATFEQSDNAKTGWGSVSSDFQCYFLVEPGTDMTTLASRLGPFAEKHLGEDMDEGLRYSFQPLKDLHHNARYSNYSYRTASKGNITSMIVLAIFLLVTACINFVNLATAQASQRLKEVGVRKLLGSRRWHIVRGFLVETAIICLAAILLAIGFSELALIEVNRFLDLELTIRFANLSQWVFLFLMWLVLVAAAGLYPAWLLSGFKPLDATHGVKHVKGGFGFMLRKMLVVFQFTISQLLIIGTIVTHAQLDFFKQLEIGFKKEGVINLRLPNSAQSHKKALKDRLNGISGITQATLAYRPPASGSTSVTNLFYEIDSLREEMDTQMIPSDHDYVDVFEMEFLAGTGIAPSDTLNMVIVNETFVNEMNKTPEEAVGEIVHFKGQDVPISGVVKDFYTFSIRERVIPVTLYANSHSYQTLSARFDATDVTNLLDQVEKAYKDIYPDYGFQYTFMDEDFQGFYESEQKMSDLLTVFASIAIFIGCLGLFGLVSYMANRKMKEIGIRKVLGASVPRIVTMFSIEFLVLVAVAFLIAGPASYFGMLSWLESFENRVDLSLWMFMAGAVFSAGVALLTIAYKSIQASLTNPVQVLRDE